MRVVLRSLLSVILGFFGGMAAIKLEMWRQAHQVPPVIRAGTVRADRFELLGPSDVAVAYWGHDWQRQRILIAFVDEKGKSRAEFGTETTNFVGGGPVAYTPFTALIGSEGGVRLQQRLDPSQNPVLVMGDSGSENRLLLGHWLHGDVAGDNRDPWDKWSLVFRDRSHDYAEVGATTPLDTKRRTGYVSLRNSSDKQLTYIHK